MKTSRFLDFINQIGFSPEAFLFDLDGVILDSEGEYQHFWEQVSIEYGYDSSLFPFIIKGMNIDEIARQYFPAIDRLPIKQRFVDFQLKMKYSVFDGVWEVLDECKNKRIKTAIVTSSDKEKMDVVYSQHPSFRQLIDVLVTSDDIHSSKPAPDCWIKAADVLGVSIERCVIFEDSINGLKSSIASGGYVVGIPSTHKVEEISSLCHCLVSQIKDLIE